MIRLFIAIDLPKEIKSYLKVTQDEIIKKIDTRKTKIKWVAPKNIHQTLKFIGYIDETRLDDIKSKLKNIKFNNFKANLEKLSAFPTGNNIKVIFLEFKAPEIFTLKDKIDKELEGYGKEDDLFASHLTLGRLKSSQEKDKLSKILQEIKIEKKQFAINEITLFQSKLTKEGPIYTKIPF
ncbi:MAG: RNA 2',3'-cyclic phosphodiesterase [Candidatus Woesearchaeota archaeon]|nr:MAG: RNA 2',3'-cyclic phosphodiesterase [Candidatus Woesearchaeota archaeon]